MSVATPPETAPRFIRFPFGETGQHLLLRPGLDLSRPKDLLTFCLDNPDWRIERTARGELWIEMPTKGFTGACNALINYQLVRWALENAQGIAFDSSAGFELPDGAMRSPDAAWVRKERLATLTDEEKQGFLPLAPDFVVELRSPTDRRALLDAKMAEWIAVGVALALLIDPEERTVTLYRPGAAPRLLVDPERVDCAPEMPGLVLDARTLFDAAR